jgi:hypothetical protein
MKLPLTILMFSVAFNIVSQEPLEKVNNSKSSDSKSNNAIEAYCPDEKLLNKDIWQRVSVNRFACAFLRLAVELKNNEYLLFEMDGNKRLLIKHEEFSVISKAIVSLTLRTCPLFIKSQQFH